MVEAQATYIREARAANGRGHQIEGSAQDARTAYGKCRNYGAELVVGDGTQVTTRPDGNCTGPTHLGCSTTLVLVSPSRAMGT